MLAHHASLVRAKAMSCPNT